MRRLLLSLALLASCSKPAGPSATAAPTASSSASGPAASSSAPAAAAEPRGPVSYAGTYSSTQGSLHVPDGGEWSGVKWRGDEAGVGLGDGRLSLTIDPGTGRAEGTADGPIGPAVLSGILRDGILSFTVSRKKIDDGLTGAARGVLAGEKVTGTMNLSLATGNVLREATFSLSKK